MGYYTKYNLSITKGGDEEKKVATDLSKVMGYGPSSDPCEFFEDLLEEPMKWYEHEKDMKAISLKYLYLTFLLEGEGEESGDMWRKYFRNGMSHTITAKIVFEKFDESIFRDRVITKIID